MKKKYDKYRPLIGLLLIIIGICLGVYVGLWLLFVGGIINIVVFVKGGLVEFGLLGWGVVKIVCAGFVGGVTFVIFYALGMSMLE